MADPKDVMKLAREIIEQERVLEEMRSRMEAMVSSAKQQRGWAYLAKTKEALKLLVEQGELRTEYQPRGKYRRKVFVRLEQKAPRRRPSLNKDLVISRVLQALEEHGALTLGDIMDEIEASYHATKKALMVLMARKQIRSEETVSRAGHITRRTYTRIKNETEATDDRTTQPDPGRAGGLAGYLSEDRGELHPAEGISGIRDPALLGAGGYDRPAAAGAEEARAQEEDRDSGSRSLSERC